MVSIGVLLKLQRQDPMVPLYLQNIQLLHAKVSSVPALRLPRFAKTLKTLCLRQNAITELDPAEFSPLTELEDLDIYDNQVRDLGTALEGMPRLKYEL
jgi:protein phosphatase 1 regulatory subunit 7